MKAIQAENYGCTDLSQVELEQTKGGGALGEVAKKLSMYSPLGVALVLIEALLPKLPSVQVSGSTARYSQVVTNGMTNSVYEAGYVEFEIGK